MRGLLEEEITWLRSVGLEVGGCLRGGGGWSWFL